MLHRTLRIAAVTLAAAGLAWLGWWAWREGREERNRETAREQSFKQPTRRIKDEGTGAFLIRLDVDDRQRLGLYVQPGKPAQWQRILTLPGFTVLVPHRRMELRSPWTGTLKDAQGAPMPKVGQRVREGQVLATLLVQWGPADRIQLEGQLREAQGTVGETEAELGVARATAQRLRGVGSEAVPAKQLMEAEGNLARLEARLKAAQARQGTLSEALAKKDLGVSFPFTAPAEGEVIDAPHRPGEVVPAGDLVASLYDARELWVSIQAMPGELDPDDVPTEAEIGFPGLRGAGSPLAEGRQVEESPHDRTQAENMSYTGRQAESLPHAQLVQIKLQIDRQQQGLEVIYRMANPQGRVPVGLQAEARLTIGKPVDAVVIPRSAVLRKDEQRLVYVERAPGDFLKQAVEVLAEQGDVAYLRPTLPKDAKVVTRGAQLLLSEENKESIQLAEDSGKGGEDEP